MISRRLALQALGVPLAASALAPLSALAQNSLPIDQVKIVCGFPVELGEAGLHEEEAGGRLVVAHLDVLALGVDAYCEV